MRHLTHDDVVKAIGLVDDVTIAKIIGTNATVDELAEAQAWITNDEPLINEGRPLPGGRVGELVDILAELEPSLDADEEADPPASAGLADAYGRPLALAKQNPLLLAVGGGFRHRRRSVSGSVQLPLRHRRLELRDFRGLRSLAVEGQHVAFA